MNIAELMERGQFQHRFDLAFKKHRQNNDIDGRRPAQGRADFDVIGRHFGQQDSPLFEGGLTDQTFARADARNHPLACVECITGKQTEIGFSVGSIVDIEHTMLDRR